MGILKDIRPQIMEAYQKEIADGEKDPLILVITSPAGKGPTRDTLRTALRISAGNRACLAKLPPEAREFLERTTSKTQFTVVFQGLWHGVVSVVRPIPWPADMEKPSGILKSLLPDIRLAKKEAIMNGVGDDLFVNVFKAEDDPLENAPPGVSRFSSGEYHVYSCLWSQYRENFPAPAQEVLDECRLCDIRVFLGLKPYGLLIIHDGPGQSPLTNLTEVHHDGYIAVAGI